MRKESHQRTGEVEESSWCGANHTAFRLNTVIVRVWKRNSPRFQIKLDPSVSVLACRASHVGCSEYSSTHISVQILALQCSLIVTAFEMLRCFYIFQCLICFSLSTRSFMYQENIVKYKMQNRYQSKNKPTQINIISLSVLVFSLLSQEEASCNPKMCLGVLVRILFFFFIILFI